MKPQVCGETFIDSVATVAFQVEWTIAPGNERNIGRSGLYRRSRMPVVSRQNPPKAAARPSSIIKTFDTGFVGGVEQCPLFDVRYVRHHAHHGLAKYWNRPFSFQNGQFWSVRNRLRRPVSGAFTIASRPSRPACRRPGQRRRSVDYLVDMTRSVHRERIRPLTAMIVLAVRGRSPSNP